jgi:sortase A
VIIRGMDAHATMHRPTLRQVNNGLTALVIALALYIGVMPFLPAISWWTKHEAPVISKPPAVVLPESIPADNTLVIPSIGLKETVYDGQTAKTLRQGIWHLPKSSSPDKGGNTVMAGHRFTYRGPAILYNLDKVKTGDSIIMYWQGKRYNYKVSNVLIVPPTQVSIEAPTAEPLLTIYTCTPLWSVKSRLVLQAKPVEAT